MVSTRKAKHSVTASRNDAGAVQPYASRSIVPDESLSGLNANERVKGQYVDRTNDNDHLKEASPSQFDVRNPQSRHPIKSLAELKAEIQARLPDTAAKDFMNTVNHITRLGGRKPKALEARLEKLRDIVMRNRHITPLYNAYAAMQAEIEKRLTYKLPLFPELMSEAGDEEGSGNTQADGAEDMYGSDKVERDDIAERRNVLEGHITNDNTFPLALLEKVAQVEHTRGDVHMSRQNNARSEEDTETQSLAPLVDGTMDEHGGSQKNIGHIGNNAADKLREGFQSTKKSIGQQGPKIHPVEFDLVRAIGTASSPRAQPQSSQLTDVQQELSAAQQASRCSQPTLSGHNCDQHTTGHCSFIPVQNPEDFPVHRIQEVQAQYYPSTRITRMWVHRDANGIVTQVTADLDGGSVDHLLINNARLISALGFRLASQDVLSIQPSELHIDETFNIKILPRQPRNDPKAWLVGELLPARHAYLYWLDSRRSTDPRTPPSMQEARTIASLLGRRMPDVWREVKKMWSLEQGGGAKYFRANREKCLGESPSYEIGEEKRLLMPMWG